MRGKVLRLLVVLVPGIGGLVGCAAPPPDPVALIAGRPTPAGLRRVETDETGLVYVRPGVRMGDYEELLVDPFMLSYATEPEPGDEAVRTLDPEMERRFTEVVRQAFVDKMRYSEGFTLVDQPGPGAVRVQGWLYDLVLEEAPTDDARNFPLCFAAVTVVLTVRDSQTALPLAEIGDRTQLTCPVQRGGYATTTWKSIGRGVELWAMRLRRWLEDLHALPPIEG